MSQEQLVRYQKENGICILTLNRPEALNALNQAMLKEFSAKLDDVVADPEIRVLIITGEGRSFVAGADIGEQSTFDLKGGRDWGKWGSALFRKLELMEIPTIAAVNGFALGGGCELAMACDMILASAKAKFGQPEVGLGICPGFSGTQRLPRKVGTAKAMELILTGEHISAEEAERIGLVNKVLEPEGFLDAVKEFAGKITKNAPIAVMYSKVAIQRGMQMDLDSGIALENELFAQCFATQDQVEGMNAFLEKRKAKFLNK